MGSALVQGMLASGMASGGDFTISSKTPESAARAASLLGTNAASSNAAALEGADVVFLCVKPAQTKDVLCGLAPLLGGKLLVSVVAGIRSSVLFHSGGEKLRVIRAMPNTAVRLRKGITAVAPHSSAREDDVRLAEKIFSSVGMPRLVDEADLDTITAVSGSGPAFALLMLESLAQGGIDGGLEPEMAKAFAAGALAAAASLVQETGETPLALRAEITSPAGTTAAGLTVLEDAGFPSIVRAAVRSARERSAELSAQH